MLCTGLFNAGRPTWSCLQAYILLSWHNDLQDDGMLLSIVGRAYFWSAPTFILLVDMHACWWTCTLLAVIIIHAVGSRAADCQQIWSSDCQQTDLHTLPAGLFMLLADLVFGLSAIRPAYVVSGPVHVVGRSGLRIVSRQTCTRCRRACSCCRQIWSSDCWQTDLHKLSAGLLTLGLCVVADQYLPAPEVRSGSPGGQAHCQGSGEGTGWSASLCRSQSWQRWNWVFQGE